MEEVSTILYYKILDWAGYSQNLKVAAFERHLKVRAATRSFSTYLKMLSEGMRGPIIETHRWSLIL